MTDEPELLFADLDLPEQLQAGVRAAGFTSCTPIQAKSLPQALTGHDIAGQAQTGTGKTAAFLLAAFNRLLSSPAPDAGKPNDPRALIIAPTRELAVQIHADAKVLGVETGLKMEVVFGGADYEKQRVALQEG